MLWALFADVHANLEALEACLEDASAQGAQRFAFLGDLVGYGADPGPVTEIAMGLTAKGAISVKGNHDQAIEGSAAYLNDMARAAIEWTRASLQPRHRDYLAQLPFVAHEDAICFVHASADAPHRWQYVDGPAAAWRSAQASNAVYTFCGHVHEQGLYFERPGGGMGVFRPMPGTAIPVGRHRRWLAIAGSVGQPRDGNPAASYLTFDAVRESLTFHRVPYDNQTAAAKIERTSLPAHLAYRVRKGI